MSDYNYDEQGQFFPFFVTAILLLILLPATYTTFRHRENQDIHIDCKCEGCRRKTQLLQTRQRKEALKFRVIRKYLLLAIGWSIVGYMIYRVITTKVENKIWDPYAILGLSSSASLKQVKSHYKKLSRALHPDKIKLIGNITKEEVEKKFVDITKAYKALTDEEIRRNYEEYGHPDGKQEFSIGIALPAWIIEATNGYYILGLYGILFGGLLPAIVGRWWYGSRNLTKEGIETDTAARYFKAIKETSHEEDVINMLAASSEYEMFLNSDDLSDALDIVGFEKKFAQANVSVPQLQSTQFQLVKSSEASPSSDLCRNLLYAYLNRLDILSSSLEPEKLQIIGETVRLQKGLLEIALAFNYLEPVRATMELSQHILQAIPIGGSPLLQLPGITSNIAKDLYFHEKPIRNVQDLLYLSKKEQRKALEDLSDEAFRQAINIAHQIPILIVSNIHFKVPGDKIITPGAIVHLIFTTRLATDTDYANKLEPSQQQDTSDASDVDEDDIDVLIGRKKSDENGEAVKSPLVHAPYFPMEHKPKWWAFLADPRGNRIIVHPTVITDIGTSARKWRVQFQAPPQVATYMFDFHIKSDSYCGTDIIHQVLLQVQDASKLEEKISEIIIPEPEDESTGDSEESNDEGSDDETDTDTSTDSEYDSDSS